MATRKPTVSAKNIVAAQFGTGAATLLATDGPAAQGEPSRVLQDLAEELGRMAARAMLRALDDPKTGEVVLGVVLLLISIIVMAGGRGPALGYAN